MKNVIIILALILTGQSVLGQYEQRNWIFGRTHAINPTNFNLDFYPDGVSLYPPAPIPPPMGSPPTGISPVNGFESWSVITDQVTGALQFYTDGRFVYDDSHADIAPVGGLGASPSPSSGAGRNTFVTNNGAAGAIDILTILPLTSFGNFGVNSISGPVTVTGNTINSTASCGSHIDLANSDNGYMEICDALILASGNLITTNNQLNDDYLVNLQKQPVEIIIYVLNRFFINNNLSDFETLYESILDKNNLSDQELKWLKIQCHHLKGEFEEAKNILQTLEIPDVDAKDRVYIMTLILNKAISSEFVPSEDSFLELRNIYENGGLFANVAGVFLTEYHHLNETSFIHTKQAISSNYDEVIKIDESLFHIYPNPGDDNIFIDYALENTKDASLNIYSINGTFLLKIGLNSEFGRQSIDIQSLASGIYIIGLNVDQEIIEYVKFIKK